QHDGNRFAEVFGGGEYVFALIGRSGHLGDDLPDGPPADLETLLFTLFQRASDHESRRDLGLIDTKRGQKSAHRFGHLEAALRLPKFLADKREIIEGSHAVGLNPSVRPRRKCQPAKRATTKARRHQEVTPDLVSWCLGSRGLRALARHAAIGFDFTN